jgi:XTP/dITP diphosphohydrolase
MEEKLKAFRRICTIMDELREQCPWDKKQTIESLRHLTIEEVYELSDAILQNNMTEVKKELGDIMLHLVFYARIAEEKKLFSIADVINTECEKLISRHPHIYPQKNGEKVMVANEDEVKKNWEQLKLKEGKTSVLEGVPQSLPSMVKAQRIQEKARGAGFDWEHPEQVWEKVEEELNEFNESVKSKNHQKMMDELGDVFFALINYARFYNINPDEALERTNKKFISRFQYMEQKVKEKGLALHELSLAEMDVFWNEAKTLEHK